MCLFKVPVYVEGIKVNLPDCFSDEFEPQHGKLFCKYHAEDHRKAGCPDDILGFIGRVTLF